MQQILEKIRQGNWVIMGVLNVTPDSFSDGGQFDHVDSAVKHALEMEKQGAEIIDIGGESTRPGATPVSLDEELQRVIPVIKKIREFSDVAMSIDTSKVEVMRAAIAAGVNMVNDVNALQADGALRLCADLNVPVCLMHKQGTPEDMQNNPTYTDVVEDVSRYLQLRTQLCMEAGIKKHNIIVDPGFGFGKTLKNNLSLLKQIHQFCQQDYPVLVGISRKSMFGQLLGLEVEDRMVASVSAVVLAYEKGVRFFRVHDVAETSDALKLCESINKS